MTSSVQRSLWDRRESTFPPSLLPSFPFSSLSSLSSLSSSICCYAFLGWKLGGQGSPWKGLVYGLGVVGSGEWKSIPGL